MASTIMTCHRGGGGDTHMQNQCQDHSHRYPWTLARTGTCWGHVTATEGAATSNKFLLWVNRVSPFQP